MTKKGARVSRRMVDRGGKAHYRCRCGRRVVFFRKYEGSYLCRDCFMKSIEKRFKRTIRKHNMLRSGDRVAVSLSGGKDSSAVLYLMSKIVKPRKDMELIAIMIDEGTGEYRRKNLELAKKLCKKLGVEYHIFSFKDEFGKGMKQKVREIEKGDTKIREACTYCGIGRRYLLNKKARELGVTKLCMGHTLDDEAQAVILNYVRGDLYRAGRMGPVTDWSLTRKKGKLFVPRIKPFREIPEKESAIFSILAGFDLCWEKCPYAGGIRFDAKEFINNLEKKYPGIKFTILETFDKLLPHIRDFSDSREGEIVVCRKCGEPGSDEICKTCELWR
jgi:uncharacterized protein (TIGR00269 family)